MTWLIALLAAVWLCGLVWERQRCDKARRKLSHVVHVNGIRGKSTVSRMIDAGLRAGGIRVFCKTTGTDPMVIDVQGTEKPIFRRGKANIKEQVDILCQAAAQNAQILVIECMAVQPEFQAAAQHQILQADIGIITNVRRDHTDVMGNTLPEICDALCNTIPRGGVLFTAEESQAPRMARTAEKLGCAFYPVRPDGSEPDFDFGENIALALAVCQFLGVERETALRGICNFRRDPYALSIHRLGQGLFVNGLSINDIQSTCIVWRQLKERLGPQAERLILLVNNRSDRGSRTQDMKKTCLTLQPEEVWLLGAAQGYMCRGLKRQLSGVVIRTYRSASTLELAGLCSGEVVFAIGNIAGEGRELMARVREEGTPYV